MKYFIMLLVVLACYEGLSAQTQNEKWETSEKECVAKGWWDNAASWDSKLIAANPGQAKYYINRGKAYYEMGSIKEAIEDLTKAADLTPNDYFIPFALGQIYAFKGEGKTALEYFKKGAQINPNEKAFQACIDFINDKTKTEQDLREAFGSATCKEAYGFVKERAAKKLGPVLLWYVFAQPYYKLEFTMPCKLNINERATDGTTALYWAANDTDRHFINTLIKYKADPDIASEAGVTALMVACGGKQEKADYVKLLVEYGASPFLKDKQGFYAIDYAKAKEYTNTAALLTNAINNRTLKGSEDFKDRGEYYYKQKEFAKAVVDFSEAIKLSPSNVTYYYYRGTANYKSGNKAASEADFAKVLQLNPSMAKAIEEERARLSAQ